MDDETRDKIRMAISGQKEEPVTLETTSSEHPQTEDVQHPPDSGEMSIDGDRVLQVLRQLYPVHLDHAVAEVKSQMLAEQLQALRGI